MLYSLSHLSTDQLAQVVQLEKKLGKELLAFSGHKAEPETLSEAEIKALREAEQRLGLCLVAVKA